MENENSNSNFSSSSSDSNFPYQRIDDDEQDIFYFESDHVALKGNKDYHLLLRTIALLEAQRTQAISELDKLQEVEKEALSNPIKFVEKLQSRQDPGIPEPLKVARLPILHWEQYTSSVDPLSLAARKHMTRKKRGPNGECDVRPSKSVLTPNGISLTQDAGSSQEESSGNTELVRGRIKNESKPSTFNKLWTAEEQQRLEELLVEFPPEPVEANRWKKVANALGNRTTQQVASRVQKYFIRLAKSGLPIPGRMPNVAQYSRKGGSHRHQRYNRLYFQPSTFMQSYQPPVYMDEGDDRGYDTNGPSHLNEYISDEEDISPEKRLTVEYQELMRLKRLKRQRLGELQSEEHVGFQCDQCGCEPIVGTRWHCKNCPEEVSVDFCDECMDCQYDNGTHLPSHTLEPIHLRKSQEPQADKDYMKFTQQGDYNYLDPNYMPAS